MVRGANPGVFAFGNGVCVCVLMALALQSLLVVVSLILGLSLNWLMMDDVVSAMLRFVV